MANNKTRMRIAFTGGHEVTTVDEWTEDALIDAIKEGRTIRVRAKGSSVIEEISINHNTVAYIGPVPTASTRFWTAPSVRSRWKKLDR